MNKKEFLKELKASLKQFSASETEGVLTYYDEMITEKTEQGTPEHEVIDSLGNIKSISARIQSELVEVRMKERKNFAKTSNTFFIVLMLCASPALLPLGIAFFAVFFSIFITCLALVVSFGATAFALLVALIPVAGIAASTTGAGGALLTSGVFLILIGVFALLTMVLAQAGISVLGGTVKITNKIVQKFHKEGKK